MSAPGNLTGYADPLNARCGGSVDFMLHDATPGTAEISLVRLLHGDTNPLGPGFVEKEVTVVTLPRTVAVGPQYVPLGSWAKARDPDGVLSASLPSATLFAFIKPTTPGAREQIIAGTWDPATKRGFALLLTEGGQVALRLGDKAGTAEIVCPKPVAAHAWHFVAGGWDETGKLVIWQKGLISRWNSLVGPAPGYDLDAAATEQLERPVLPCGGQFTLAAALTGDDRAVAHYNGKIDRHGILNALAGRDELASLAAGELPAAERLLAYWDTTAGYTDKGIGDVIRDVGPHGLHAHGINRPIRAMTGWNWDGRNDSFRLAPHQYGGIAFHDDALVDCGWQASVSIEIPPDLPSGVYALRISKDGSEDHVPFFVRPDKARADMAVLMPTFTYLAYANEHLSFEAPIAQAICANTPVVSEADLTWKQQEAFGLSTYDVHSDYAGVCYSSWRRPIQNMRPKYRMPAIGAPWAFPADLSLIWWLDAAGYEVDVVTDHDLAAEGLELIAPYRAVLTGTHPEYYSLGMLDALEDYVAGGGRVGYLGGNGLYWVTEVRDEEPWCIEVRKLDTGSRAWQAAPGEGYLATTGDRSGLWRARGRPPQKLVALGFTTEGMDESQPFERMPDSFEPEAAWLFEGVGHDELIGNFGLGLGGASGLEMDRYDLTLGTPPHTLLVASSFNHSDNYPLVSEDITYAFPGRGGTQDPQVRGDIAFYANAKGGAVFAAGSIAWSQALPCNGGRNNVARIMTNVLDAFRSSDPPFLPRT